MGQLGIGDAEETQHKGKPNPSVFHERLFELRSDIDKGADEQGRPR